jgi:DNA polymerase (family 10)
MTKTRMPLAVARELAERTCAFLLADADAFTRAEVAGSVRRARPEVGDIEVVAQIDPERAFGASSRISAALRAMGVVRAPPITRKDGVEVQAPWGDRYMKGVFESGPGGVTVQLDLFMVSPPAEWGVVYLIRTGSADFSHTMVTRIQNYGLRSESGHLVDTRRHGFKRGEHPTVPCPTEEEFFRLAQMPFIPPEQRELDNPATAEALRRGV